MPAYNAEAFIEDAIRSLLAQTYDSWECVVADDASTDGTWGKIQALIGSDKRFRLFRHERNLGMTANWNFCLRELQGRYVAKLDADDLWERDFLATCVQCLDADSEAALVFTHMTTFGPDDPGYAGLWPSAPPQCSSAARLTGLELLDWCLAHGNFITSSAVVWRRELLAQAGPFDERLPGGSPQDMEMWLRLAMFGAAKCIPERLVRYRVHGRQSTNTDAERVMGVWHTADAKQLALDHYFEHDLLQAHDYVRRRDAIRKELIEHYGGGMFTKLEVYWSRQGAFSPADSASAVLRPGLQTYDLPVHVQPGERLRIDPANRPGLAIIQSISLLDEASQIVWSWNNPSLLAQWMVGPTAFKLSGQFFGVLGLTRDPQLVIGVPPVIQAPRQLTLRITMEFSDSDQVVGSIASQVVAAASRPGA